MAYVTLDMAKRHLNIEPSYTDEDSYIEAVEELATIDGGKNIPMPLVQAMLLCLGAYYTNRENTAYATLKEIPQGAKYLVDLYRDYSK